MSAPSQPGEAVHPEASRTVIDTSEKSTSSARCSKRTTNGSTNINSLDVLISLLSEAPVLSKWEASGL